jgi:hypothetical protein
MPNIQYLLRDAVLYIYLIILQQKTSVDLTLHPTNWRKYSSQKAMHTAPKDKQFY